MQKEGVYTTEYLLVSQVFNRPNLDTFYNEIMHCILVHKGDLQTS